jgi:hypothetical protein
VQHTIDLGGGKRLTIHRKIACLTTTNRLTAGKSMPTGVTAGTRWEKHVGGKLVGMSLLHWGLHVIAMLYILCHLC